MPRWWAVIHSDYICGWMNALMKGKCGSLWTRPRNATRTFASCRVIRPPNGEYGGKGQVSEESPAARQQASFDACLFLFRMNSSVPPGVAVGPHKDAADASVLQDEGKDLGHHVPMIVHVPFRLEDGRSGNRWQEKRSTRRACPTALPGRGRHDPAGLARHGELHDDQHLSDRLHGLR